MSCKTAVVPAIILFLAAPKVFVIGDADDLVEMGKERLDSTASD
jgi:hypothetical protein